MHVAISVCKYDVVSFIYLFFLLKGGWYNNDAQPFWSSYELEIKNNIYTILPKVLAPPSNERFD